MGRLPAILREAVRCALAAITVLLATEAVLRVGDDFGRNGPEQIRPLSIDGVTVYRGRPWLVREFRTPIHLNEDGYHATGFGVRSERPRRVAVLGDSYVKALQVPREDNFVATAEEFAAGIQFLGLGGSARFFPRQVEFLQTHFDALLGPSGIHPPVDAVVFCVRAHSMRHVAEGSLVYRGFPPSSLPWQYRLKSLGHPRRRDPFRRGLRAPSHAVSLLSSRLHDWLDADLRRELPVPTPRRVADAHRQMVEHALLPALAAAEARHLPTGFLYLPSVSEAIGQASSAERDIHARWIESFTELGVPYRDAAAGLTDPAALFFASDRHPNRAGHRVFAARLAALATEMLEGR